VKKELLQLLNFEMDIMDGNVNELIDEILIGVMLMQQLCGNLIIMVIDELILK